MRAHSMRSTEAATTFLHGDQTRCEEIFTWSTTPHSLAEISGETKADVRLVCSSVPEG